MIASICSRSLKFNSALSILYNFSKLCSICSLMMRNATAPLWIMWASDEFPPFYWWGYPFWEMLVKLVHNFSVLLILSRHIYASIFLISTLSLISKKEAISFFVFISFISEFNLYIEISRLLRKSYKFLWKLSNS